MVVHFPYRRRYVDIIYRISRGILKHTKVVGTGLNQKPISGGMGKVVKRVRVGGNQKAISGDIGTDVRNLNYLISLKTQLTNWGSLFHGPCPWGRHW